MGLFEQLPYTNFHELNLSELIKYVKKLGEEYEQFRALNTVTYGGVWSITTNYPAWSIVSDSNGNGYISVRPVPSGINITNSDYWVRVYDFLSQLGVIDTRVTNLENTSSSHTNSINNLNTRTTNNTNSINNINSYVNNRVKSSFADRTLLFVGDSYTNGGNVEKQWYKTMCDTINPRQYYVSTEGGEGFCSSAGKHYLDRINDFINSHTTAECESITDLFITGGYNDLLATVTDIQSAANNPYNMEKCVLRCREKFPNATIYIAFFARTALVKGNARHNIIYIERTATAYREGARWLGCKYVTNSEIMLHDYRLFDIEDNVHPNQLGHNYLGHYMAQWFMNGSWSYNTDSGNNIRKLYLTHGASDVVEGHQTLISPSIGDAVYEQLTDEGVIVRILPISSSVTGGSTNGFDCAPATSVSTNTFNLGYFNSLNYRAYFSLLGSNDTFKVMGNAIIKDMSGNYHDVPCIITISSNNEILLNFQKMNGNNYQHYNGLESINYIAGCMFTLPLHAC